MFSPWDLIFPIGTSILAIVLCVLALRKAEKTVAKVITILTTLVFVAAIPVIYSWRYRAHKHDYKAVFDLRVRQGELNKCVKEDVDAWANWVVDFWSNHYDRQKLIDGVKGDLVVCLDEEKISAFGMFVRGYATGSSIVVGYREGKPAYTESLFKHELSHNAIPEPWDQATHHKIFKEKGLGH